MLSKKMMGLRLLRVGLSVCLLALFIALPILYLWRDDKSPPPLTVDRWERIMSLGEGGQWKCVRVDGLPVTGGRK